MRKLHKISIILLAITIFTVPFLLADGEGPKAELPVLVASCGQCPDYAMLKVILMRAKLEHKPNAYQVNSLATAEDLIKMKAKKYGVR